MKLPSTPIPKEQLFQQMETARAEDAHWREGKVFSLVFHAGEEVSQVAKEAYTMFMSENGLNPTVFPSLKRFESDVISMSINLLGGGVLAAGNMTSGGTESILMAVYTAREWAKTNFPETDPKHHSPEIVAPISVHPAFEKAGHYFGIKIVHAPLASNYCADVEKMRGAISPATILMVGSAPAYPHGAIDPISDLAQIAQENGILFHVDACVGGFILPFIKKVGYEIPDFDLSVPGVTSISADLHKYAYAAKGASVILYRDKALRRHQLFAYMNWPGGIYASPSMGGTRPGGAIASAWAVLNFMGESGYMAIADKVMQARNRLFAGIAELPDLQILGDPKATIFAIASKTIDIFEVGDELQALGWHLDRQQFPSSLHVTLMQQHIDQTKQFLQDIERAVAKVKRPSPAKWLNQLVLRMAQWLTAVLPEAWVSWLTKIAAGSMAGGDGLPERSAAMYGMLGSLPNRGDLREVVLDMVEGFTENK
ncbi:MAG: aspartate aminotransferase family protein [Chloroflexota bacterium]